MLTFSMCPFWLWSTEPCAGNERLERASIAEDNDVWVSERKAIFIFICCALVAAGSPGPSSAADMLAKKRGRACRGKWPPFQAREGLHHVFAP